MTLSPLHEEHAKRRVLELIFGDALSHCMHPSYSLTFFSNIVDLEGKLMGKATLSLLMIPET